MPTFHVLLGTSILLQELLCDEEKLKHFGTQCVMNMNTPKEGFFETLVLNDAVARKVSFVPCCMNILQACVIVTCKKKKKKVLLNK